LSRNPQEDLIEDRMVLSVNHSGEYLDTITVQFHEVEEHPHGVIVHCKELSRDSRSFFIPTGTNCSSYGHHGQQIIRPSARPHMSQQPTRVTYSNHNANQARTRRNRRKRHRYRNKVPYPPRPPTSY